MLLAIDPDLFVASLQHGESNRAIEWLVNNIVDLEFAFDRQKVLLKEYATFLENHVNQKELAVVFLNDLLSNRTAQIAQLDSSCSHDIQELINRRGCNQPVEPTLIGMGIHAPTIGLTILLAIQAAVIRRRGLHDPEVRKEFCKQLPKLKVAYAHSKISMPSLEVESKTEKDLWFEDKMRIIASQIFDGRPRQKTPLPVETTLGGRGADVDVYIWKEQNICRDVWIGECKLCKVNEDQWVETKKVEQLRKRLPVVREYERSKIPAGKELNVKGIIISNAANMAPEAWEAACELEAIFWHVELSEEWRQREHWHIVQIKEYEPEAPSDENLDWHGRFVRTISVE